jgi:ABC-2 type transport system permease protein
MNVRIAATIARNELRRLAGERALLIFGVALPVVIIVLVGSTFGGGAIHLGVVDQDGTPASAAMVARLEHRQGIAVVRHHDPTVLRRDVRSTALDAGIVVPKGFSAGLGQGSAEVDVVVDPKSRGVASALAAVQSAVDEEGVQEGAVRLVATDGTTTDTARQQVVSAGQNLAPVVVRDASGPGQVSNASAFSYTAPSNLVLFVFINTFAVSTLIAIDRREGRIRRIMSTPNRPGAIVAGIGGAKLCFALVQSAIIVGVGRLLFGVQWGDPVAAFLLIVVFAALSTAVGLIFGSIVQDADQAQSIGIPLAVAMGMLGGCMWPLSIVPHVMRVIGHIAPQAWAMDAWTKLVFNGAGVGGILPELMVLSGATLVLSVLAARLLRRSVVG